VYVILRNSRAHADDGYSRRGDLGSAFVHNMGLTYSLDRTNVCGSRGGKFEGIGSV